MDTVRDILLMLNAMYKTTKEVMDANALFLKPSQEVIFIRALYRTIKTYMERNAPNGKYSIREWGIGLEVVRDGIQFHAVHEGNEIQFYIKREKVCAIPETFLEQYISVGFDVWRTNHYPELVFIAEFVDAIKTLDLDKWKKLAA